MSSSDEFSISINQTVLNNNSTCKWTLPIAGGYVAKNKKIALVQAIIYNAIPNIAPQYNNISFNYIANTPNALASNPVNLIPLGTTTGVYVTINDINSILQAVMFTNGHYLLDANLQPYYFLNIVSIPYADRFAIESTPIPTLAELSNPASPWNGFKVPFNGSSTSWSNNNPTGVTGTFNLPVADGTCMQMEITATNYGLATNLGFPIGIYPTSSTISGVPTGVGSQVSTIVPSPNIPFIVSVTSLSLSCNWAIQTPFNSIAQQVAAIPINADYNVDIVYQPPVLNWYPVADGNYATFEVSLTEQTGIPLTSLLEAKQIVFIFKVANKEDSQLADLINALKMKSFASPPLQMLGSGMTQSEIEMKKRKYL
jgi:hypothetical protein